MATSEDREAGRDFALGLDDELVREVGEALDNDSDAQAASLAAPLHPADQADLLQLLGRDGRDRLVTALGADLNPDTLVYLDGEVRDGVLRVLGPDAAAAVLAKLETDDAIDLLSDLDEDEKTAILALLPLPDRAVLEQGLAFPEYSAGRLMQRELVVVPEYWTVGHTIDYLRATPDLPDDFYDIFIVDARFRPVGSVPLSHVLRNKRTMPMRDLKLKELRRIPAEMDQEEVAFIFRQYGLVSAPVVDPNGRVLGVITVDDVVDVISEEAEDDILKLGGIVESDVFAPLVKTVRKRLPWLVINMATAILAATVISWFEASIDTLVSLAILMPIVASMGGNAGTQTMTVTVRGIATRDVSAANVLRVVGKEALVGLTNGAAFLVIGGLVALVWFGRADLAAIFGVAMTVTLFFAASIGVLIPLGLNRFGIDPAVASGVFVTTVTDVFGFFTFLGLATLLLL